MARIMPEDERQPLKGSTFLGFEEQVLREGRTVLAAMLEERVKLDRQVEVNAA